MIDLSPPPHRHMRYDEMVNWLTENGFSIRDIRRWVDKQFIKQHFIGPDAKRAYYNAEEIKQALDGNREETNNST